MIFIILYFLNCQSIEKKHIDSVIKENQKIIEHLENKELINNNKNFLISQDKIKKQLERSNQVIIDLNNQLEKATKQNTILKEENKELRKSRYTLINKIKLFFIGFIAGIIFLFTTRFFLSILKLYYKVNL
jgi:hypothetical protein